MALDPNQLLDDVINRFESRETILGNDAMRGTIGLFQLSVWLRVSCYLLPQWRHSLASSATKPKKWSEQQSVWIKEYPRIQAEGRSSSLTWAVTSDRLAPVKLDLSCM